MNEPALLELISDVYAAAEDPARWTDVLRRVARLLDGHMASFVIQDLRSNEGVISASVGFDPEFRRLYEEHYSKKNIWLRERRDRMMPGEIFTGDELVPFDKVRRSEYFNEFLDPQNVRHHLGGIIAKDSALVSGITVARPPSREPFGDAELAVMRALMPHLQRAVEVHRQLAAARARLDSAIGLENIPTGVVLLDQRGLVLELNQRAKRFIDAKDGLGIERGVLTACLSTEKVKLGRLIVSAVRAGLGQGFTSGGALAVSRPSGGRPFDLLVTPLSGQDSIFGERLPCAAVFISTPEESLNTSELVLQRLYKLTAAESGIACALAGGKNLQEAADALGITVSTARSHLKKILDKTGTNRQSELIRILSTGVASMQIGEEVMKALLRDAASRNRRGD